MWCEWSGFLLNLRIRKQCEEPRVIFNTRGILRCSTDYYALIKMWCKSALRCLPEIVRAVSIWNDNITTTIIKLRANNHLSLFPFRWNCKSEWQERAVQSELPKIWLAFAWNNLLVGIHPNMFSMRRAVVRQYQRVVRTHAHKYIPLKCKRIMKSFSWITSSHDWCPFQFANPFSWKPHSWLAISSGRLKSTVLLRIIFCCFTRSEITVRSCNNTT